MPKCSVCKTTHDTKKEVEVCRKRPVPVKKWQKGDVIVSSSGTEIKILSAHVKLVARKTKPRHEILYSYQASTHESPSRVQQSTLERLGYHLQG